MRSKLNVILVFGLISHGLLAYQYQTDNDSTKNRHVISVDQSAVVSGKRTLPFWFVSNNSYRLRQENYLGLWTSMSLKREQSKANKLDYFYGIEGSFFTGNRTNFSPIQAYAGFNSRWLSVRIGLKEEFFGVNDSTLSIGNLSYGNNARPIPKLVVRSNGWIKSPVLGKIFSVKAYLAHGWLEKDRYQSKALLHQKYFYLRVSLANNRVQLTGGLHHTAQWGGYNSTQNKLQPAKFSDFTRIFFASSGGANANQTDQLNALGNHLGSYDLNASIKLDKVTLSNYWQFLWEDKSGLTPFNWRDGILGISVKRNSKTGLIHGFNLEIIRTNSQDAIKYDKDGNKIIEPDNFFNNSVYQSGWTFKKRGIANPVFLLTNPEANTFSKIKNMVNGVNVGIHGEYKDITYRINFRHFKNSGTFLEVFNPVIKSTSIGADLQMPIKKASLRVRGILEWSNYPGKNAGLIFSYVRTLSF